MRPQSGRAQASVGQAQPKCGRLNAKFADLGPKLLQIGPSWSQLARIWSNTAQIRENSAQFWSQSARLGRIRTKSGRDRRHLAEHGQPANVGCLKSVRNRSNSARFWPKALPIWTSPSTWGSCSATCVRHYEGSDWPSLRPHLLGTPRASADHPPPPQDSGRVAPWSNAPSEPKTLP